MNTFKTLLTYLNTLPVSCKLSSGKFNKTEYELIKDKNLDYLLEIEENTQNNKYESILLGYFVTKPELHKYQNGEIYPSLLIFDNGTGFIPHNLDGRALFMVPRPKSDGFFEVPYRYYIHGKELTVERDSQFHCHPEVVTHKNKLSLKKKLKSL